MNNKIIEILNHRLATRAISTEALTEEIIGGLIEAVRLTPSCFNKQPWNFLFITTEEGRRKAGQIFTGGNAAWAPRAPLIVVGYSRAEDDCQLEDGREYHQFDLGMAVMNLMLAATERGLAARPMAGFEVDKARDLLEIPAEYQPMIAVAIGYPSEDESHLPDYFKGKSGEPRVRKDAGEIVKRM